MTSEDRKPRDVPPHEDSDGAAESIPEAQQETTAVAAEVRSADTPIERDTEDRLRRSAFAAAVARDIEGAPQNEGYVVAITGAWGDGKTSAINLLKTHLSPGTEVLDFNPWLFSGTEQLVDAFFEELSAQLRESPKERLRGVAPAFQAYARVVTPLMLIPGVGQVAGLTKAVAESLADATGSVQPASARQRAKELKEKLEELPDPIVVVVDDIDRLDPGEIFDIARLVRLVGDFPNLVYVLAFDRKRVEQALGEKSREDGRAYLEKIVQILHPLPEIDLGDVWGVLAEDLNRFVAARTEKIYIDGDHLGNIFAGGMRELFTNVRDVKRFMNLLPTTFDLVGDEVDCADVLALESIRLFAPESFEVLAADPQAWTTTHDIGFGLAREKEEDAHRAEKLRSAFEAAGDLATPVEELVRQLFPAALRLLGGANYGSDWLASWRKDRRVASPDILAIYLQRRLPQTAIASGVVEEAVRALREPQALDAQLAKLSAEQLERLLTRLIPHAPDVPTANAAGAISVLLKQGQRLERGKRGFSDFGADVELGRVLYRMLRDRSPEKVESIARSVDYSDLSGQFEVARIVGHRKDSGHKLVPPKVAEDLERQTFDRLLAAAAQDLADERDLGPLMALGLNKDRERTKAAIGEWATDDRFFVHLLHSRTMTSFSNTVGEAAVRRRITLNWPSIEEILGGELARRRLGEVAAQTFETELGEDGTVIRELAVRFAADPEAAKEAMRSFVEDDDEEDE